MNRFKIIIISALLLVVFQLAQASTTGEECLTYSFDCSTQNKTFVLQKMEHQQCSTVKKGVLSVNEKSQTQEFACQIGRDTFQVSVAPGESYKSENTNTSCLKSPETLGVEVKRNGNYVWSTSLDIFCDEDKDISIMRLEHVDDQAWLKFYDSNNVFAEGLAIDPDKTCAENITENSIREEIIKAAKDCTYKQNITKAIELYERFANEPSIQQIIGNIYTYKTTPNTNESYKQALHWYKKAHANGNKYAPFSIGNAYQNGYGVTQSYDEAIKWYEIAAEKENFMALITLGKMYFPEIGFEDDYKLPVDYKKAFVYFNKAIATDYDNRGHKSSYEAIIGSMHENGLGVEPNLDEAVKWYKRAESNGLNDVKLFLQRQYAFKRTQKEIKFMGELLIP